MLSMPFPAYLLNSTVLNGLISFLTTFLVVYGWHLDQKMDIVNSIKFGLAEAFTNNSSFHVSLEAYNDSDNIHHHAGKTVLIYDCNNLKNTHLV